ncbi:MAG: hypothetical protein A4E38_01238 [Methanoregulaceae archaeon PtaB.Bin108]|nr:MAG: hypothetical protein A4E38_01238 [Methanoregulaceae archaeon PtaB.Bin108]
MADATIAYIARFASPSARRMEYPILTMKRSTIPLKMIRAYSAASGAVGPAPNRTAIGSASRMRGSVTASPSPPDSNRPWIAALFAPFLSHAPIRLAMVDVTPDPIPTPSPIRIMKRGVMNPIAAIASDPRPATQTALTTL